MKQIQKLAAIAAFAAACLPTVSNLGADGTESLGMSYSEKASDILVSGTGMYDRAILPDPSGRFDVSVPAGVDVKTVFIYWSGRADVDTVVQSTTSVDLHVLNADESIASTETIEGELIGGNDLSYAADDKRRGLVYRADVTSLGLLTPDSVGRFRVDTLPYRDFLRDGIAMVAVIDNGSDGTVEIHDGRDFVYALSSGPAPEYLVTAPVTQTFPASDQIRLLSMCLMAADLERILDVVRPNLIEITFDVGSPVSFFPGFDDSSHVGPEFDILRLFNVEVPAGATEATVTLYSVDYNPVDPERDPASLNWFFAAFILDEMPDSDECGDCDGKVTDLVFKYEGDLENPTIQVDSKRGSSNLGVPVVQLVGDSLYFIAGPEEGNGGFYGTLGTEIYIYVNGELNAQFHTSCSQPIGPGLKHGDILIVEGTSKNGGALCPVEDDPETPEDPEDCECEGKVTTLELAYTGPALDGDLYFITKKGNDNSMAMASLTIDGTYIATPAAGQDTLGTDLLIVLVKDDDITPLAQFHTSCSQPIGPGATSGDFSVVSGASKEGDLCELDEPHVHELNISKFHLEDSSPQSSSVQTVTKKTQKRGKKK